jgi:excinuclease ABC subunit A
MRRIQLRGARTNNLRAIDLDLEPGTLVAVTGPSGAGKSSLAFGTLYAEGQRRYVESFSAYARQFLERLARPPVDSLEPVPAAVAVDRSAPVRSSRSTVATMTEISDYAKTLWARCAVLHCPDCGRVVQRDDPGSAARAVIAAAPGSRVAVTFPVRASTDEAQALAREGLAAQGYARVLVGAEAGRAIVRVEELDAGALAASALASGGHIHVVADRTSATPDQERRLVEAIAAAMHRGSGRADVHVVDAEQRLAETHRFSDRLHCAHCDRDFRPATPGLFSFNSPIGACPACRGFGRVIGLDVRKVLPDSRLSLAEGAIRPWRGDKYAWERGELKRQCRRAGVPWDAPVSTFDARQMAWLVDGDGHGWWGVRQWFAWLEHKSYKMHVRVLLARYRSYDPCPDCGGARLRPEALWWRHGGLSISDFLALAVAGARAFLEARMGEARIGDRAPEGTPGGAGDDAAAAMVRAECLRRLRTLGDVGLDYLELDRASRTLSGGEAQRVALTGALGASLAGALIVLDEPTVGLHPRDVDRLADVIERLTTADNTVLVVEHDWAVIGRADREIELGPGAGAQGGQIVFDGPPQANAAAETSRRLATQAGRPEGRRQPRGWITLRGASGNNLAGVDVAFPRGVLTCVTGPSGSGKSTLVLDTLAPAVARLLDDREDAGEPLAHAGVDGAHGIGDVIVVDQAPLGRTARGNPATYVNAWDWIRGALAKTELARARGYTAGTFSFNVPGGRCEACKGEGAETVEMQFLADVSFSCPECGGRRFAGEVLDVEHDGKHGGKNVVAILEMTVREALEHFGSRKLDRILGPVVDVGLGYLRLGQPLNTLSGGEAQRLKLAEALGRATPGALLVLDEPTAGLHATDVHQLLVTLQALVERGDTVVVIEHDMDVAAHADWVIDLGPGAGAQGGRVVGAGTPEDVARTKGSATSPFLSARLAGRPGHAGRGGSGGAASVGASRAAEPGTIVRHGRGARARARGADIEGIEIAGAREHNLAGVSLAVPRESLVVVTGPSGSGKSTLAFDVLYAEGQRRYLETLSPYARQYMPRLPRPAVDRVAGVPPSVALEQRIHRSGASSTVATITEVAHYLRVLYARAGLLHCPDCGVAIAPRSPEALARDLRDRHAGASLLVLAPVVRGRKGLHREILARARERGMERTRIDGALVEIEEGMSLARHREHDVDLVVAELGAQDRGLVEAVAQAASLAGGSIRVLADGQELYFSTRRACPSCGTGFPELDPRMFSFNTRQGACERCEGRGVIEHVLGRGRSKREVLATCSACAGTRLSPLARSVTVDGRPITDILGRSVSAARELLADMHASITRDGREASFLALVAAVPLAEVRSRLAFLSEVGVGYLDLDRPAPTLSGGELQRVRLAAQLGSGLTGILYVLDEPTIGLHPRDTGKLIAALRGLVDRGNSLVVVEHDSDTIRAADHLIDIGPGGGRHGGRIVAQGPARAVLGSGESPTAAALARPAPVPAARRPMAGRPHIELRGARLHNLRDVDVRIPLGCLVVVTGVSGSGKSTLIREVLLTALDDALGQGQSKGQSKSKSKTSQTTAGRAADAPACYRALEGEGARLLRRAVEVDQSPIGRTSRSVPATYIGIWDQIRGLLASTPEARARGYGPARFSFNVAEGRCPACEGQGTLTAEMAFLPDVEMPCDACGGMRFSPETQDVTWRGLHAGEILALEVEAAALVFAAVDKVVRPLRLLADLGLGYLKLGQPSSTLSGGEAQRLKLVSELGTRAAGGTLYVLDEPTTGLHRNDIGRLLAVFERLVARGDTAVIIEHHLDVMLMADWIIDLGPEGGAQGGRVVACGTPEDVAACTESHTGAALAREIARAAAAGVHRVP